jgi:hypothetical protein
LTRAERIMFIRLFVEPGWYVTVGGVTDEVLVVVPSATMSLYPHRKRKK